MIIGPFARLFFYVSMVILPIWQDFVSTSSDYTLRGLLRPILASASAAVVVILARTRNPIVDGDKPIEVTAPKGEPLKVTETKQVKRKR